MIYAGLCAITQSVKLIYYNHLNHGTNQYVVCKLYFLSCTRILIVILVVSCWIFDHLLTCSRHMRLSICEIVTYREWTQFDSSWPDCFWTRLNSSVQEHRTVLVWRSTAERRQRYVDWSDSSTLELYVLLSAPFLMPCSSVIPQTFQFTNSPGIKMCFDKR